MISENQQTSNRELLSFIENHDEEFQILWTSIPNLHKRRASFPVLYHYHTHSFEILVFKHKSFIAEISSAPGKNIRICSKQQYRYLKIASYFTHPFALYIRIWQLLKSIDNRSLHYNSVFVNNISSERSLASHLNCYSLDLIVAPKEENHVYKQSNIFLSNFIK